jgi:PAS domain-containing protein
LSWSIRVPDTDLRQGEDGEDWADPKGGPATETRTSFLKSPDPYILDGLGRVVHFNERAATLLERPGSTLRGMRVVELLGRDLLETSTEIPALTLPLMASSACGRAPPGATMTSGVSATNSAAYLR